MDTYLILLYVTTEQEEAIRTLFAKNKWNFMRSDKTCLGAERRHVIQYKSLENTGPVMYTELGDQSSAPLFSGVSKQEHSQAKPQVFVLKFPESTPPTPQIKSCSVRLEKIDIPNKQQATTVQTPSNNLSSKLVKRGRPPLKRKENCTNQSSNNGSKDRFMKLDYTTEQSKLRVNPEASIKTRPVGRPTKGRRPIIKMTFNSEKHEKNNIKKGFSTRKIAACTENVTENDVNEEEVELTDINDDDDVNHAGSDYKPEPVFENGIDDNDGENDDEIINDDHDVNSDDDAVIRDKKEIDKVKTNIDNDIKKVDLNTKQLRHKSIKLENSGQKTKVSVRKRAKNKTSKTNDEDYTPYKYKYSNKVKQEYREKHLEKMRIRRREQRWLQRLRNPKPPKVRKEKEDKAGKGEFPCDVCKKVYTYKRLYLAHIADGGCKNRCKYCGKVCNKNNLPLHVFYMHEKEAVRFKCDKCDKRFYRQYQLRTHMEVHGDKKNYVCDICGKAYFLAAHLWIHKKSHERDASSDIFSCPKCDKTFKCKYYLRFHLNVTHSSARDHMCDLCGSKFKTSYTLKNHKRAFHGEARIYTCHECGRSYKYSHQLSTHRKTTHQKLLRHFCPVCSKGFLFPGKLKDHMNIHKGVKPHKCLFCPYRSHTGMQMTQHKRKHRRQVPPTITDISLRHSPTPENKSDRTQANINISNNHTPNYTYTITEAALNALQTMQAVEGIPETMLAVKEIPETMQAVAGIPGNSVIVEPNESAGIQLHSMLDGQLGINSKRLTVLENGDT